MGKSSRWDNIDYRMLRDAHEDIAGALMEIFEHLLATSKVAETWRIAHIDPLFKMSSRHKLGNYKPVSLTSMIWKLEKNQKEESAKFWVCEILLTHLI